MKFLKISLLKVKVCLPKLKQNIILELLSQNKGKESENSYQELKRSPKDRHTQTHGNCIEIKGKPGKV